MRHLLPVVSGVLLASIAIIIGASYLKFYNERTQNYYKHLYVLQYECQSGRQLPQIQYNTMTYDGTSTNCTEALVFTSILPSLGAVHDMWVASPFFALMYATDWKIQVAYAVAAVVGVMTAVRSYFGLRAQQAVLDTFSSSRKTAQSSIDQRPRMMVKVPPEGARKTPMQALAEHLLHEKQDESEEDPVFTKLCAPMVSHSAIAPYVVGTGMPNAVE